MTNIMEANFVDLPEELSLPAGTWRGIIKNIQRRTDQTNKQYTLLTIIPVKACDDVDPEALEEWNNDGDPEADIFIRIYGSERSQGAQLKRLGKLVKADSVSDLIGNQVEFVVVYSEPNNGNPDHRWFPFTITRSF